MTLIARKPSRREQSGFATLTRKAGMRAVGGESPNPVLQSGVVLRPSPLERKFHTTQKSLVPLIRAKIIESRIDLNPEQPVIPCNESFFHKLERAVCIANPEGMPE